MKYVMLLLVLFSCVMTPEGGIKKPTPIATMAHTPRPRLTDIPPFSTPTPKPTSRPFVLSAPSKADQCEKFTVILKGPHEKDDIVIWAEQRYHIGRMFYDVEKDEKYLSLKLNTSGERELSFKIDGVWQMTHKILIVPHPENCVIN